MQRTPDDYDGGAGKSSNSIELRAQHCRDFPHEHIAHHAAANSSQHAEQHRRNRTGA